MSQQKHAMTAESNPAEELKHMRQVAGYTQAALAHALGVNQSAVNLWEAGSTRPGRESTRKLKQIFGSVPEFRNKKLDQVPWFVYFACQPTGLIKIGITSSVGKRLKQIQENSGYPTTLIVSWQYSTRKEAATVEAYLKNHFADKNTLGEWFEGIEVPAARINPISCEQAA